MRQSYLPKVATQQTGVLLLHELTQRPVDNTGLRLILSKDEYVERWSERQLWMPSVTKQCPDRSKL